MTRMQGGRVVFLHALIHTQMARLRVTNLKSKIAFENKSLKIMLVIFVQNPNNPKE